MHQLGIGIKKWLWLLLALAVCAPASADGNHQSTRQQILLSGAGWQFTGAGAATTLPEIGTAEFASAPWAAVSVPHVFQTRAHFSELTHGWYRRNLSVPPELAGKQLYLVFEGAATIADVFVNGQPLGQHRGGYTRFVFDATKALKPGDQNELAVRVDNTPANMTDCLPNKNGLYTIWGGLYRKVWLVATDPLHVELEDYASSGVYITPQNVSAASADLSVKVLVKNSADQKQTGEVRATLLDPSGTAVKVFTGKTKVPAGKRTTLEFSGKVKWPKLWEPATPNLYHVKIELLRAGNVVDEITQPTGFRNLVFETTTGRVKLNGKPIILFGADLHQEIEAKASAMVDEDFRANYAFIQDLGFNFMRLPHYPHAQLEYDLCDQLGIFCWAENGHSNRGDKPGETADRITTELVKQNYNHPSIALWSVGNEAGQEVADREVPVVKALDPTRIVVVANMKSTNAAFHGINSYPGWYGKGDAWSFAKQGYVSETGAGGVTTIHCDYADASVRIDKYEPEEYQQLLGEARFQEQIKENDGSIGMFCWWTLRDFTDVKYKKPIGWNTKGLLTYASDKQDVYYLYRCFLRPNEPTVHLTSQRYFLRTGAVDNGIKAYSSAAKLTLTLNGETIYTLANGSYTQTNGRRVDNVFFWKTPLHTGKNVATVSDGAGHSDSAVIYFYGANSLPELPATPLVTDLQTSGTNNRAYFMDMPVRAQWPIYYDLDGSADNSFAALPPEIEGAKWIALRRVTKDGQETDLSFKLERPATVYVMATQPDSAPSLLARSGFQEISKPGLVWRDNRLMLVSAQLFSRSAAAGEVIHFAPFDRDAIVLVKE